MPKNPATQEAIANADAYLNNVCLPTYTELLEALEGLCGLAELRPGHLQDYKAAVSAARAAIAKANA